MSGTYSFDATSRKRELLAKLLEKQGNRTRTSIPRRAVDSRVPLSYAQQRLWFMDQLVTAKAVYNIPAAIRIKGELHVPALENAFNEILRRHEILRTVFAADDGEARQVVQEFQRQSINIIDVSQLPEEDRETEALRRVQQEAASGFDLTQGPLTRSTLLRMEEADHVLMLTMHHIVSDGWSVGVFMRELKTLYSACCAGKPSPLPDLPIQYADFSLWQRERMESGALEQQLAYWKERLSGAPELLDLPLDRARPAARTDAGAVYSLKLNEALSNGLRALSQKEGASLFMTMLAAFNILLHRYTHQQDIVVGTSIANRHIAELEPLIGFFVNVLALRTQIDPESSYRQLLQQVRETALGAYANQDLPFEKIVDALGVARTLSHTPLFQAVLVVQNASQEAVTLPGLDVREFGRFDNTSKYDVMVSVDDSRSSILAHFEYSTEVFAASTIERMAAHLERVLEAVVSQPDIRLNDIQLLSEHELNQLLVEWNDTATNGVFTPIVELIEAQVRRTPRAPALALAGQSLTYDRLNRRANQLAEYLRNCGAGPETIVAIMMERSIDLYVAVLAVLKAGGAYLPIDTRNPADRVNFILKDSGAALVLTDGSQPVDLTGYDVIDVSAERSIITSMPDRNPFVSVRPDYLAYSIYTSGTTGRPKGTLLNHGGLSNLVQGLTDIFQLNPDDRILQFSSIGFDASVLDLFHTWSTGACVHIAPSQQLDSAEELVALFRNEGITCAILPPSLWSVFPEATLPALRVVIAAGEVCSPEIAARLSRNRRFLNGYGPTEITVAASFFVKEPGLDSDGEDIQHNVPIGRPLNNVKIYLLDEQLQPVPVGVPGELYVGGNGVGRGYLNRADLTAEKFLPDPFSSEPGSRFYRTGDLARYRSNGQIEFLGRVDHQVKLRGFRVELQEIERALETHPQVQTAVVTAPVDAGGSRKLAAYVVLKTEPGATLTLQSVRAFLKERLPEYMLPSHLVVMDRFPMTSSGKIDRKALPAPKADRANSREVVSPRTAIEKQLCKIWSELLGVPEVSIHDNFFELGGDSILGIQMVARATAVGIRLKVRQLFQHQTIAGLALVAEENETNAAAEGEVGPAPVTPIQAWFFERDMPEAHFWNQAVLMEVDPRVTPAAVRAAIGKLVEQHSGLRSRFRKIDTGWVQDYTSDQTEELVVHDFSTLSPEERTATLEASISEAQRSLDFERGPVIRSVLYQFGSAERSRLLVVAHHLVIDNVSWRILLADLETCCQQFLQQAPLELPPAGTSFSAWSRGLQEFAGSAEVRAEEEFWTRRIPAALPSLPMDFASGGQSNTRGAARSIEARVDADETRKLLKDTTRLYGVTINDVLLAALALTFQKWTGNDALLVDLESHGREPVFEDLDLTRTVGWFTSCYPLLLDLSPSSSSDPWTLMENVATQAGSVPNDGIGYGVLRYLASPAIRERFKNRAEAEISFNYLGQFDQMVSESSLFGFAAESVGLCQSPEGIRQHLLEITAAVTGHALKIDWTYSPSAHTPETIQELSNRYIENLKWLIAGAESGGASHSPLRRVEPVLRAGQRTIGPADRSKPIPASDQQRTKWVFDRFETERSVHNTPAVLRIHGTLNRGALERGMNEILRRHDVMRTTLRESDGTLLQVIHPYERFELPVMDLTDVPQQARFARAMQMLGSELRRAFDLEKGPIFDVRLLPITEDDNILYLNVHHVATDVWSLRIFLGELSALYGAFSAGKPSPLDEVRLQYADFAAWQQNMMRDGAFEKQLKYWRTQFSQLSDSGASPYEPGPAAALEFPLPPAVTEELAAFGKREGVTSYMILLSAFHLLLRLQTESEETVVGTAVSNRGRAETENMIGFFANPAAFRARVREDMTGRDLLDIVRESVLGAFANQEAVPDSLRGISGHNFQQPPFSAWFAFDQEPAEMSIGGLRCESIPVPPPESAQLHLKLRFRRTHDGLAGCLEYRRDIFDEKQAAEMAGRYQTILELLLLDPKQSVSELVSEGVLPS
jgi:amino acid adenylation domain-containing protein/non-ribosomal peptide synthase protein (TIGR01720 family)